MLLLVQLLQVWSMASGYAVPSGREPVRMSCVFGMSPTPLTMPALLGQRDLLAERVADASRSIVSPCSVAEVAGDHLAAAGCTRGRCRSGRER